jgi:succinate-acetate transporter protein
MEAAGMGPGASGTGARGPGIAPAREPTVGQLAGWTPADPGPLGLAGFAGTTFVLSIFNANLVSSKGELVVLGLAFAYGGLAQLLAGMWEFRTGNTFGAVAFSSFGAFWISFFILLRVTPVFTTNGVAVYLYMWAIFTTWMFVASLRTTAAVAAVFVLLAATFWILAIGWAGLGVRQVPQTSSTIQIGGWLGLATAIVAWYAAFAAVINSTFGRIVLPVVPLKR